MAVNTFFLAKDPKVLETFGSFLFWTLSGRLIHKMMM
jgi:hypothetical protein